MSGKDYIANVRLRNAAMKVVAEPGETCERVPASSLPWLIDRGRIRKVVEPQPKGKAARNASPDAETAPKAESVTPEGRG